MAAKWPLTPEHGCPCCAFQRTPNCGDGHPSPGSAYTRVGHGDKFRLGDTLAGKEDLERDRQKSISLTEAAVPLS